MQNKPKINVNNKTIGMLILALVVSAAVVVFLMLFLPFFRINSAINEFYKNSNSDTLVSNEEIVRSDKFKPEIKRLKFNFREPKYAVFYKGEDYKNFSNVVITDFFYLKRSGFFGWEVVRYESSYVPYLDGQEKTLDEAYKEVKDGVLNGEVSKGLTPEEEKALSDSIISPDVNEGDLIDFFETPDKSKTFELLSGKRFGSNYLVDGNTGENLGIENVVSGKFSQDGKYFIYSIGEYFEPLGEILPDSEIWVMNVNEKSKNKVFEVGEYPNELMFYSNGNKIMYGSKNKIGIMNMDGSGHEVVRTFSEPQGSDEHFILPEIIEVSGNKLRISIPRVDFVQSGESDIVEIEL